jgi:hypothetical protein
MMDAQGYLGRSRLFRRLKIGPHGQLVERYAARLVEDGLVRHGTWRCLNLVGGLLSWIASSRSDLADLDERMVDRYLRHRGGKQSIQPGDRADVERHARDGCPESGKAMCWSLRAFLRYLHHSGLNPLALAGCVPSIRQWKLASLPTYLSTAQVQKVLDGCDRTTVMGRGGGTTPS